MSTTGLPGFRDFYPAELAEREHIFKAWRTVARRYAMQEYDGPPLESLELYTRKSGEEIVGQLYHFEDKGERQVALRPEMTPTFARMVAARANALRKPVRWFSIPQLFRYERQQKGRLREHFQLNADIVGEPGPTADAEIIALAVDVMRELGLTYHQVNVRLSDRRLIDAILDASGVAEERRPATYRFLDKTDDIGSAASRERLAEIVGDDADAAMLVRSLTPERPSDVYRLTGEHPSVGRAMGQLDDLLHLLSAYDVSDWVKVDLSIVRGLAYYTGTVFELFDTAGEFRAICGGGRYDNLLAALGGADLPSVGFGMGDVVLGELLKARGLMPTAAAAVDYWVASWDGTPTLEAIRLAARLREKGRAVEYALRTQSPGKQLKAAAAAGAKVMVVVQQDGRLRIRRLAESKAEDIEASVEEFVSSA